MSDADEYERWLEERRLWMAQELGIGGWILDATWGSLMKLGLPYELFTGGDNAESRQEILKEAKDYLKRLRDEEVVAAAPSGRDREREREAAREIEIVLDGYTRQRGEVMAELAAARPDVRAFRRRHLQDRLLSDEEADSFLRTDRALRKKNAAQRALQRLGEDLERAYGWRARRARRFVLTGRAPAPVYVAVATGEGDPPLSPPKARITVEADAWVDAREVEHAFRAVQRQLLSGSGRKRPDRTLEVVRFVAHEMREHGWLEHHLDLKESWSELRRRWNQEHQEWKYKEPRLLRQTFERFMRPKKDVRRPKWPRRRAAGGE